MIAVGIGKQMAHETASEIMGMAREKTGELLSKEIERRKNEQATDKTEETETP